MSRKEDDVLERIDARLDSIDITLAKQAKDIEHHIKRTDLLESQLKQVEGKISPIRDSYQQMTGALKLVGFVGLLASIGASVVKIFHP